MAKLLGLGYPGGPWIDALAVFGDPHAVPFSFAQIKPKAHLQGKAPRTKAARTAPIANLDPHFLFSFSGIKTAVLRYVELHHMREEAQARIPRMLAMGRPPQTREDALALCPQATLDLIASFQHAVVGDLMKKTFAAAEALGATRILVTGGVAANRELRARFTAEAEARGLRVAFPTLALSTDNAAMIAAAAWPRFVAGEFASGEPERRSFAYPGKLRLRAWMSMIYAQSDDDEVRTPDRGGYCCGACVCLQAAASHLVTGNGFGFAVVAPETGTATKFYAHPYSFVRPDPANSLSEGIETANFIKALGWSGGNAQGASAEYVEDSHVIRVRRGDGEGTFFMPFGFNRPALVISWEAGRGADGPVARGMEPAGEVQESCADCRASTQRSAV